MGFAYCSLPIAFASSTAKERFGRGGILSPSQNPTPIKRSISQFLSSTSKETMFVVKVHQATRSFATKNGYQLGLRLTHHVARAINGHTIDAFSARAFSSARILSSVGIDATAASDGQGFIKKPLKALDLAAVRQIKAELMEVDANFDGR